MNVTQDSQSSIAPSMVIASEGNWFTRLFKGRIGRARYIEGALFALLPFFVLVTLWGLVNLFTGPAQNALGTSYTVNIINNIVVPVLFALAFILFFCFHFSLAVRRCHDFDSTGWLSLATFIPYVGVIFALYFLFKKGDAGANKYGSAPVKGRKFLAEVFNY